MEVDESGKDLTSMDTMEDTTNREQHLTVNPSNSHSHYLKVPDGQSSALQLRGGLQTIGGGGGVELDVGDLVLHKLEEDSCCTTSAEGFTCKLSSQKLAYRNDSTSKL